MRPILVLAVVLGTLTFLPITAQSSGASEADATEAGNATSAGATESEAVAAVNSDSEQGIETESLIIPKWRLSVRAFPHHYYDHLILGIYYRVGDRYDLGISVDGDIDLGIRQRSSKSDDPDFHPSGYNYDEERYDIRLSADLRRWGRVSDRTSWYWGGRLSGGYTYNEDVDAYTESSSSWASRNRTIGVSIVMGADLQLIDHLSVSFGLAPLLASYNWYNNEGVYVREATEEWEAKHTRTIEKRDVFSVEVNPHVAAFLSLTL